MKIWTRVGPSNRGIPGRFLNRIVDKLVFSVGCRRNATRGLQYVGAYFVAPVTGLHEPPRRLRAAPLRRGDWGYVALFLAIQVVINNYIGNYT